MKTVIKVTLASILSLILFYGALLVISPYWFMRLAPLYSEKDRRDQAQISLAVDHAFKACLKRNLSEDIHCVRLETSNYLTKVGRVDLIASQ